MNRYFDRYATPLITGFFIVSAVSGVALFFRWTPSAFHAMHEWLSMVLLVPFALHLWKNWRGLVGYLKRKSLVIPLALSVLVAVPFAYNGLTASSGGSPAGRTIGLLTGTPIAVLAPVLKTTPDALVAKLKEKGYANAAPDSTLSALAAGGGTPASQILFSLMPRRGGGGAGGGAGPRS